MYKDDKVGHVYVDMNVDGVVEDVVYNGQCGGMDGGCGCND